jgi:inosine/xanthosine triphosphate pyrophosphatase family protein
MQNLATSFRKTSTQPEIQLITSSDNKLREVQQILGNSVLANRVKLTPVELQPSNEMELKRLRGPGFYGEVAVLCALTKFQEMQARNGTALQPGAVLLDTAFFQVPALGFPGVLAASFFYSGKLADGTPIENTVAPRLICEAARLFKDYRLVWTETVVLAEDGGEGKTVPKVFQSVKECFAPPTPQGNGWAFDVCAGPDPIEIARIEGNTAAVNRLLAIKDRKFDLACAAAKEGYLRTFAELGADKHLYSPRGEVFRDLARYLNGNIKA